MKIFFFIHFFSLLLTGVVTTDDLHQRYTNRKNDSVIKNMFGFYHTNPFYLYRKYTATETGFGFFAPNVKSNGLFIFNLCNEPIKVGFKSREGNHRYSGLVSKITSHLLINHKEKTIKDSLIDKYYNLVIQNIAAKVYSENNINDCSKLTIEYHLIEFPPLKKSPKKVKKSPILVNLKNWKYDF